MQFPILRRARTAAALTVCVIVVTTVGALSLTSTAYASPAQVSMSTAGQDASADVSTMSRAGTSDPGAAGVAYLSTQVDRGRSAGGAMLAAVNRCPAFVTWEDWLGGARVHAYVDFHPSDNCNGRRVKSAYVRLIRQCGPYYDSGRIYTYTATSSSDTRLYSVSAWIFDSVSWGCVTTTNYGYDYF